MDTSDHNNTPSTSNAVSDKNSSNVMAPLTSAPSVLVSLHPLVIMNISEHWTRVRAQCTTPQTGI